MIRLQVNHDKHHPLRTEILRKEASQSTEQTEVGQNHQSEIIENAAVKQSKLSKEMESDKQSRVIGSIQATTLKVKKDLEELINEYKSQAQKIMTNHGHDAQKQAQIQKHLRRLQQQKKERKAKFDRDLARLHQKREALQKSGEAGGDESVQRRRKSIEQRIAKIKQREKRRREAEAQFMKFYEEYKESKPRFRKMEEEFNKKEERQKEEKLQALKHKIQETYHPMNLEELSEFEEEYLRGKRQAEKIRLRNHLEERKKEQANLARLSDLYKGHCHSSILRELEQRQSKTNQSYQKYRRIKQYSEIVKEEYKPKTRVADEAEEEEETSNCPMSERGKRVVKERYIHGQYLGKKIEFEKVPLSHSEHISKGIQYLQFLKKLPKRPKPQTNQPQPLVQPQRKRTISSVYRVERRTNPLYRGKDYNSIDLSDRQSVNRLMDVMRHRKGELELDEKLLRNGNYQDRQSFMSAQKEYNNKLVGSIERKLQILKKL